MFVFMLRNQGLGFERHTSELASSYFVVIDNAVCAFAPLATAGLSARPLARRPNRLPALPGFIVADQVGSGRSVSVCGGYSFPRLLSSFPATSAKLRLGERGAKSHDFRGCIVRGGLIIGSIQGGAAQRLILPPMPLGASKDRFAPRGRR